MPHRSRRPPRRALRGLAGVVLAAVRVAARLGEEELEARARALLATPPRPTGDRCPDIVSGGAGAIIAFLALSEASTTAASGACHRGGR